MGLSPEHPWLYLCQTNNLLKVTEPGARLELSAQPSPALQPDFHAAESLSANFSLEFSPFSLWGGTGTFCGEAALQGSGFKADVFKTTLLRCFSK